MATVESSIESNDFSTAIVASEDLEMAMVDDAISSLAFARQLLLYITIDDLENARHLWRRIPVSVKTSNPELEACWAVGKCLWQGTNIPGAFTALQAGWSAPVAPIAAKAAVALRSRQLNLLSTSFTTISLSSAALSLGLDEASALELCTEEAGWTHDSATGFLNVLAPSPAIRKPFDGLGQLEYLTEHVTFLESRSVTKA